MTTRRDHRTAYYRSLVHSLPFSMATIDRTGRIVETNRNWREFGEENDLDPHFFDGEVNYLEACRASGEEDALRAAEGISSVLEGKRGTFRMEYPCHSSDEKRWFLMQVSPLVESDEEYFVVIHFNITERRLSEERSRRLSAIVDRIPVCIVTLRQVPGDGLREGEPTFVVTNFNPYAEEITGLSHEEVLGRPYREVFDELFGEEFSEELAEVVRSNVNFDRNEVVSRVPGLGKRTWSLQAFNVTEGYVAIAFEDVSGEVENREQLEYLATYDELTDLVNRDHLLETFRKELDRALRYGVPLSFLLLDLDHFKEVNDTYGHVSGDDLLEGVGAILNEHTRTSDLAGRYGGEEFGVILPETEEPEDRTFAERICEAIEDFETTTEDGRTVTATSSIGVSEIKSDDSDIKDLMRRTDEALYEAKEAGRNRVVCWSEGPPED